jgi:hypothetical protein
MSAVNIPHPIFPHGLDDDSTLLRVHDVSESRLAERMLVTADAFRIVPDFHLPEKWSPRGGYAKIGGEDLFYSKGDEVYATSTEVGSAAPIFVSQFDIAGFDSPMMIDGLLPAGDSGRTSVTMRDERYTCAGVVRVGDRDVEFAVKGNGAHGAGAIFFASRPDLIQLRFCSIDADAGKLMVSTISFGWSIRKLFWIRPALDERGLPLRRVHSMSGLIRGMRGTTPSAHDQGETVRGNIMAEHHVLLTKAVLAMQGLVGEDDSEVVSSQDFRLRDLSDLCVEKDDFGCPDATLDYEETTPDDEERCLVTRSVSFEAEITGDYDRFAIFFGDGTSTSQDLAVEHLYPSGSRIEPYIYAAGDRCEVSSGFFDEAADTVDSIPEIPTLVCPDILIPPIPNIPDQVLPDFEPSNTTIIINGPTATFPSIFLSIPDSIYVSIPPFPTIGITIPPFPTLSIFFDPPPITVVYTINIDGPTDSGPCFQLVPCGTGYHHPGYH